MHLLVGRQSRCGTLFVWPERLDRCSDGFAQLLARDSGLRTVIRQNAIEQNDFRAPLGHLSFGRVKGAFGRGHEKPENQGGDGGNHAGT